MDAPASAKPEEDSLYLQVAEDRLSRKLPDKVSESQLMRRYGVGRTSIQRLLYQICQEGWIQRRQGHGWEFQDTLSSARGYEEAYRFRGKRCCSRTTKSIWRN
jgi:DNA-binding GntR family transcriptional regulator